MKRVAIIGGGISGLAAAHRAAELDPSAQIALFERSDRIGGIIQTIREDGYLIETSADSFIINVPWAIDLCRRIGFVDHLIPTDAAHRGAMVVCRGQLYDVPEGFLLMAPNRLGSVLRSPILSVPGKLRLACESLIAARRSDGIDESLASFARRRLGREAFDRLVQPLIGGIYTADPEKLSLAATLPRFLEMERRHGSLLRAARANRKSAANGSSQPDDLADSGDSGARYSLFMTPREGLSSFVDAIAKRLPPGCVRLNLRIDQIRRANDQWQVGNESFDAAIVATSAPVAARLLSEVDASLAAELAAIEHVGSAIVILAYDKSQIVHPLNTFGFVVPQIENRRILSASFSSVKFPGRAPDGKALIRVFLGGALQPEMVYKTDEELILIASEELADLLGITGPPNLSKIFRWHAAMPQYHLGHLDRLQRIKDRIAKHSGLALAGNAFTGVGIPQCIRSGELAGEKVNSFA
ncbi:MAG: protoporphyrinogen oxidase [Pirellulales bacterium]|nr:protoporphyrinogen oxidase [Pirellulales bacterium]